MNNKLDIVNLEEKIKVSDKKLLTQTEKFSKIIKKLNKNCNNIRITVSDHHDDEICILFHHDNYNYNNKKAGGMLLVSENDHTKIKFVLNLNNDFSRHNNILIAENLKSLDEEIALSNALLVIGKDINSNINKYSSLISSITNTQLEKNSTNEKIIERENQSSLDVKDSFLKDVFSEFDNIKTDQVDKIMNDDNADLYYISPQIEQSEGGLSVKFSKILLQCNNQRGRARTYKQDGNRIAKAKVRDSLSNAIIVDKSLAVSFEFLTDRLGLPNYVTRKTLNFLQDDFYSLLKNKKSITSFIQKKKDDTKLSRKNIKGNIKNIGLYGF
jgi:hypothetical protein